MATEMETPRLLLRRWQQSDVDDFIKMNADPQVMRYFPAPYSSERTQQFYAAIQEEFAECGYGLYAVQEKSSGAFIGFTGFHRAAFNASFCPCVEIGWRLASAYWNRGYATEGAKACLAHGFTSLGFEKVYSFTALQNLPSQRVMQKLGMQFYENFEHPDLPDNHPLKPHVCYVARREDWHPPTP